MNKHAVIYNTLDKGACQRIFNVCKSSIKENSGTTPYKVIQDQLDPEKSLSDLYMATYEGTEVIALTSFRSFTDTLAVWCTIVGNDSAGTRRWHFKNEATLEGFVNGEDDGGCVDIRRIAREAGYKHGGIYFDTRGRLYKDYVQGKESSDIIEQILNIDANTILVVLK